MSELALLGGQRALAAEEYHFAWPVVTPRMEKAVPDEVRSGKIAGLSITAAFHCAFYNGRFTGILGEVAAFSSMPATKNRRIYERAIRREPGLPGHCLTRDSEGHQCPDRHTLRAVT